MTRYELEGVAIKAEDGFWCRWPDVENERIAQQYKILQGVFREIQLKQEIGRLERLLNLKREENDESSL